MARQVNYVKGTVVTSAFMNSIQEVESGLAVGIRLERASATQITLKPVSDGSAGGSQSSLIVNGQPRWFTAAITKTCEGAKGTYSVYVTAGETTTLEAANITVTTGGAPANSRKIGEVDWSGAAIERVRQTGMGSVNGTQIEDGAFSSTAGPLSWTREASGAWVPAVKSEAITTGNLAALAVTAAKLAAEAVTEPKLAALAVATGKLANSAVTAGKLANEVVEETKIKALAVTAAKLAASAVEEAKIKDAAVTSRKLKPTVGVVAASENLTLTGAYADVPGAELEITPLVPSTLLVTAVFDLEAVEGSEKQSGTSWGSIKVDAELESTSTAIVALSEGDTPIRRAHIRNTVSQVYRIPLTVSPHTIKLRAKMGAIGSSTGICWAPGTAFLYMLIAS